MPELARVLVYPVKSLDPLALDAAEVLDAGGLSHDREYALVDADGEYVNAKRERAVHGLASDFDPDSGAWTVGPRDGARETFRLPDERDAAAEFLSAYFGYEVGIERDASGGFPDDTHLSGPTVVAEATLDATAEWFDGVDAAGMCRRLRPNLVVSGVEPFWEDRLYGDAGEVVPFEIGGRASRA
ncbi:MOSC domain-containing protein [Halosegnis marinus]|uniref:MOSC domain-containing protein n=1 Tax=Halosegnis marinus TaxID=3034023 RepID=UPI003614B7CC